MINEIKKIVDRFEEVSPEPREKIVIEVLKYFKIISICEEDIAFLLNISKEAYAKSLKMGLNKLRANFKFYKYIKE